MNVDARINLNMSQRLVMTPMLQQAIKLLQMSRIELVDLVKQEMLENPVLDELEENVESHLDRSDEPVSNHRTVWPSQAEIRRIFDGCPDSCGGVR